MPSPPTDPAGTPREADCGSPDRTLLERMVATIDGLARNGFTPDRPLGESLGRAVRIVASQLGYRRALILRATPRQGILRDPVASWEPSADLRDRITSLQVDLRAKAPSALAWAALNRRPLWVSHSDADRIEVDSGEATLRGDETLRIVFGSDSSLSVPLCGPSGRPAAGDIIGLLCVGPCFEATAVRREIDVVQAVADRLSLGVECRRLGEQVRRQRIEHASDLEHYRQELRESYHRLFRYERREFHLDLIAGLAHDLKNPLVAGRQFLRILDLDTERLLSRVDRLTPGETRDYAHQVQEIIGRVQWVCSKVQESLLSLERRVVATAGEPGGEGPVDVAHLLEESLAEIPSRSRPGLVIHRDIHPVGAVDAHPDGLRSLFMNIVVNAIESLPPGTGGEVRVGLRREGSSIILVVEDNGQGIPSEIQGRIFEPRFSTKKRGTGLGLAWVHRNVTQHLGGQIKVDSGNLENGMSTRFTVTIPVQRPEARDAAPCPDCR